MLARWCGGACGLVRAITMASTAPTADDVNHFCPLTTWSAPSATAVVPIITGCELGISGSVKQQR